MKKAEELVDKAQKELCRKIIVTSIRDMSSPQEKKNALLFFLSKNFNLCCQICGYDRLEILQEIDQMADLNEKQSKMRGMSLIKNL